MCASETSYNGETEIFNGIDLLFSRAEPRSKFKKFKKFQSSADQETSFCLLYRFDAIITYTVNSLSSLLSESETSPNQNLEEHYDHTSRNNKESDKTESGSACMGVESCPKKVRKDLRN